MMNHPILLLGSNGLLGSVFAEELRRRGIAAVCLDRFGCDVTDAAQVAAVFNRISPQSAINCTAYTKVDLAEKEPDQAFAINATAVANIARACAAHRTRLIHFSTDFVFDGTATSPYHPTHPTSALSVYGKSKLAGETLLREIDPPGWLIARTSWLFGVTGPCFPRMIVDRASKGQPLRIVNDQIGSPTYAPDLAGAILDLLGTDVAGLHHLTNSGQCSWYEFAKAIAEEFGIVAEIAPITTAEFLKMRPEQAKRPAYSVMADEQMPAMRGWREALGAYGAGEQVRQDETD
jgi:dTDP-4-dehydrorhamnose reductase